MVRRKFDLENKFQDLSDKVQELAAMCEKLDLDLNREIESLSKKLIQQKDQTYKNLNPWDLVLLSRMIERPSAPDFIAFLCEEWMELHGDRLSKDDPAVIGGIGSFTGLPVTIVGYRKGLNTQEKICNNFGMPHPEGYRKVQRLLFQAEKFKRPVITFIDTPGAFPGIEAEKGGQAWAVAQVLLTLSGLRTPVVAVVSGEGGSGGALALAVSDRLLMLSNAVFSVASPEACASILLNDIEKSEDIASVMKITAQDLFEMGIVDEVIEEPIGGAHQDPTETFKRVKESLERNLEKILYIDRDALVENRLTKLRKIGRYLE